MFCVLVLLRVCVLCFVCSTCTLSPGHWAGAIKLVAEAFPWSEQSHFAYTLDNHNSVLGVREVAMDAGATATAVEPHASLPQGTCPL